MVDKLSAGVISETLIKNCGSIEKGIQNIRIQVSGTQVEIDDLMIELPEAFKNFKVMKDQDAITSTNDLKDDIYL